VIILGKSKKRILAKAKNSNSQIQLTRENALWSVMKELKANPSSNEAKNLILLFGLTPEELSESGISYEVLRSLDEVFI
jgi:hypothetical protein